MPLQLAHLVAVVAGTSPLVRRRLRRRRADVPLALLSDHLLQARWAETEADLRRTSARPDQALAVVSIRAELLDEIVRRQEGPQPY